MPSRRFLSVWSLYSKCYEVDFGGGYLWVASGKGSSLGLFLVQKEEKFDATQSSMVLENSQGQYFVKCCDIFQTGSSIDLVFEFMNMSLTQIIGAPRLPTEQEVLAIVGQVGAPMGSLTSYLLSKLVEGLKAMRDSDVMQGQLHASRILINLGVPQVSCKTTTQPSESSKKNIHDLGQIIQQLVARPSEPEGSYEDEHSRYSSMLLDFIAGTTCAELDVLVLVRIFQSLF
ncbi:hypothetical protein LTS08_007418 [Lithohypha guttulata]|nr:hypothetical protein LTS08_007418 [Lithohypha guttulata]